MIRYQQTPASFLVDKPVAVLTILLSALLTIALAHFPYSLSRALLLSPKNIILANLIPMSLLYINNLLEK